MLDIVQQICNVGWMCTGVVECPVRPCPPTKENYEFYIDRLDELENVVYAHYSFQIQFDENNDYSVYMDGCCRPADVKNKFELPFHLRAGIQLYANGQVGGVARPYPKQSMVVNMPNTVMLRSGGVAYDECKAFPCGERVGGDTVCFMYFQVQTYQPVVDYRDKLGVSSLLPTRTTPQCRVAVVPVRSVSFLLMCVYVCMC